MLGLALALAEAYSRKAATSRGEPLGGHYIWPFGFVLAVLNLLSSAGRGRNLTA
jgi:hypothetical protein